MKAVHKIIVIGNGMVGYKFCEKLVEHDVEKNFHITVFGDEPRPAYDRVHLSSYFAGTTAQELQLSSDSWYEENGIDLHVGERIVRVDVETQKVLSHRGNYSYDTLVFAAGSKPFVPKVEGVDKQGVFVYRTIEDLDDIARYAKSSKTAAVIGGGLLGLEAAKASMDLGLKTSVVEFSPKLMPRQLDTPASAILQSKLQDLGIDICLSKNTQAFTGDESVTGLAFVDGSSLQADMVIISAGIIPNDDLARNTSITVGERAGIVVNSKMETSVAHVYAIGEVALYEGMIYGLVAPGYKMAEVVVAQLMGDQSVRFDGFDMSTKLKLIGVDVASFGDPFCDKTPHIPIVYDNKLTGIYKRINISTDAKRLLGGILVGSADEYNMLLQVCKNNMAIPANPESLILPSATGGFTLRITDLPDEAIICSCEQVSKGRLTQEINSGNDTVDKLKKCCKAGTGCGGCVPMVDDLITETFKAQGRIQKKVICEHFNHTRQELYHIVKTQNIRSYDVLLDTHGTGSGCVVCKPLVASLLASIWNVSIPEHQNIQDTNDKYLANIQRGGTYSVVPRIAAGEITPDKLIVIGEVAKKYDLYTKITGGQRIDLFGAKVHELPDIWEELIVAGFETGQAYGKSIRTVKSCVGSTWCRFGMHDSVGFAIKIEERYKGLRAPHKLKGGVSGCIRECAEARGKDFGIIATDKGWNLYVGGNGGANPVHAELFAQDIDEKTVITYLDRYLMFYIRTAEPLTRTSKWLAKLDGGIEYLKDVVINDCLHICHELEQEMQYMVDTYECEWKKVEESPELRAKYRHFINSDESDSSIKFVPIRDQKMPKPWNNQKTLEI